MPLTIVAKIEAKADK
ncbi:hypothetical protein KIPB_015978, partial [Kipferlia bialata]|eukprot:g15978.t1